MPQSSPMTGHRAIQVRVKPEHSEHEHSSEDEEQNENTDPLEDCRSESDFINGPVDEPENPNLTPTRQNPLPFGYEGYDDPPVLWPCFNKKCRGDRQSPINIDTEIITPNPEMGPLEFQNYDKPLRNLPIKYAGHDVYFSVPQCANITVTSKWLKNTYRLFQVSFAFRKSLHTVDSQYFPMEVSMLHLNTKYRDVEDAPDALLSIQILLQVKKTNNKGLNPVTEVLKSIRKINANTTMKSPVKIADLLPKMNSSYIAYNGSRVVPPCSEIFTYIVFHYSNTIGKQQFEMFNKLEEPDDIDRYVVRPVQALNERKIWSSVTEENNNNNNNNGENNGNGWW